MASQSNLDYQIFWAPRPLSRPRCVEGQSHFRPPRPLPKPSPLPPDESRGMIVVPRGSPHSSPRLASSRDDAIYISDDAASDINDASHELFDETMPPIQAIVQSLENAGKVGSTNDGFEQSSQCKDVHEAIDQVADFKPPDHEQLNESHRPTVDLAAECLNGVSASTPRICTSTPTSMTDGSQTASLSCESSLRDVDSTDAREASMPADDEDTIIISSSEIPQRVDSQLHAHALASLPQRPPSPLDHDRNRVGMTHRESADLSQGLASSKDGSFDVFDTASDYADTACDESSDETPPSVRAAVRSLEETGNSRSTVGDNKQTSNFRDKCEPPHRPPSSTPLDLTQINHGARLSFAEPADCLEEAPSSISRIRSPAASTPASSRLNSLSPEPQVRDTISTQTSFTSMSAAGNGTEEIDDQTCTGTSPPDKTANDSIAREDACDEQPPMSQMPRQNKRSRGSSVNRDTEQSDADGLRGALDDPEYCPSPSYESEDDSDSPFGYEEQVSRKRRKFCAESIKIKSRGQQRGHSVSVGLDQASELISVTQDDSLAVAEPADAAFDEWLLQDVVLKRTIMDGKATFLFQFDWDLCAKHGQAARKPRKRSKKQGQAKPIAKNNGRRRFTASEDQWLARWKEEEGLCWAEIHSLFCAKFEERSKEALQVRYFLHYNSVTKVCRKQIQDFVWNDPASVDGDGDGDGTTAVAGDRDNISDKSSDGEGGNDGDDDHNDARRSGIPTARVAATANKLERKPLIPSAKTNMAI
ncbi:myb family transcription factor [Beauveria brongniartii RCEF 3172]|uniref:Myb family transcription factor n=1 Tax=Beauveria brongniartii RCEF 3172 TaxID=1081107 RepID=A0A166VPI4_9HYPO|nr:myb family transcription factor [Beauveria brongniartii RCEF 3172]